VNDAPHQSIFVREFLEFFSGSSLKVFVDGTLGAGGHSYEILKAHPEIELWIGIDQDPWALNFSRQRLLPLLEGKKYHFLHANFAQGPLWFEEQFSGLKIDGMFMDLGVSSMQLDQAERGFSFRFEGPLDMRMNTDQELSAMDIVNFWPLAKLEKIFIEWGEEPKARRAAQMIGQFRQKQRIKTTTELCQALEGLWPRGQKHPATRVFQALRIAVNDEMNVLSKAIPSWLHLLAPQGRMGAISFHSLEDRMVKLAFREASKEKQQWNLLTPKPLEPTREETRSNKRSRSAKLRFIERLA
jgi:16S rRNA (cytosine1402-N4)-methyltransferase